MLGFADNVIIIINIIGRKTFLADEFVLSQSNPD